MSLRRPGELPVYTRPSNSIEFLVETRDFPGTRAVLFQVGIRQASLSSERFDLKFNQLQNFKFYTGGWVRHHKNSPAEIVADRLEAAEPSGRPSYAQPVEIVAAMPRVRFTRPKSQKSVPASRKRRGRQATTIAPHNCADKNGKVTVLQELRLLTQEQESRRETVLGRFFECQELRMSSALLARAVEQCSRWRAGKRLAPPEGSLPPTI